jgi:hypothetical protein
MGSPTVFRSKVDRWFILILVAIPGSPIAYEWINRGVGTPLTALWVALAVWAFIMVALIPTRYVIEGRTVSIKCGLAGWENCSFSVDDVQSVRPTHNPLSSPALSLDRLRVDVRFFGPVLISPKDKAGFLHALAGLNPQLHLLDGALVREA